MDNFKAVVHYHFKKGEEEKAFKKLDEGISKWATERGCRGIELLRNERDPCHVIGIAVWDSIEDARRFQEKWQEKESELAKMCRERPHHEFFKCCSWYGEKKRKAA